ncbi:hypothetical protein LUD75_14130 [Epilithonimonas sp. JDS]|uniref:hypothetical protein n=1 Tax=Epilithonimonas sp. JDS TaxID=2902797 RepID=UPI001E43E38A|nr:hypothetical protein [Epilithonimonas sp. JDS]MCD9855859.1 hypothetical protein [Epilithonimonas sp. JDS]
MKILKTFKFLIVSIVFFSCSEKTVAQNTNDSTTIDLWTPITLKNWNQTPAINNRVANEDDVKNGLAVYYIEGDYKNHKPYNLDLPKLAKLTDFDTKQEELVVIIQIEETQKGTVVGYRNLTGGNGAGLISEFEILNNEEVEKLIK